jgi:hypothetical protein
MTLPPFSRKRIAPRSRSTSRRRRFELALVDAELARADESEWPAVDNAEQAISREHTLCGGPDEPPCSSPIEFDSRCLLLVANGGARSDGRALGNVPRRAVTLLVYAALGCLAG